MVLDYNSWSVHRYPALLMHYINVVVRSPFSFSMILPGNRYWSPTMTVHYVLLPSSFCCFCRACYVALTSTNIIGVRKSDDNITFLIQVLLSSGKLMLICSKSLVIFLSYPNDNSFCGSMIYSKVNLVKYNNHCALYHGSHEILFPAWNGFDFPLHFVLRWSSDSHWRSSLFLMIDP